LSRKGTIHTPTKLQAQHTLVEWGGGRGTKKIGITERKEEGGKVTKYKT